MQRASSRGVCREQSTDQLIEREYTLGVNMFPLHRIESYYYIQRLIICALYLYLRAAGKSDTESRFYP